VKNWFQSLHFKRNLQRYNGGGSASPSSRAGVTQPRVVEPIWVTARREGMNSRVYFWPGSEAAIRGVRPTEYRPYDAAVTFEDRADAVAKWLVAAAGGKSTAKTANGKPNGKQPAQDRTPAVASGGASASFPSFHALYFEEPDAAGHANGPHSKEVDAAVRRVDKVLGRLREKTGEAAWNATNVVIVADHGMATVSTHRVVHLGDEPCGVDFSALAVSGGAVVMGLWGRSADGKKPAAETETETGTSAGDDFAVAFDPAALVEKINKCHPNVTAWQREDVPARFAYKRNRRVAPVVVAADVGWTLCGHRAAFKPAAAGGGDPLNWAAKHSACAQALCPQGAETCGAHGYDNAVPEMRALFMARGPAFRKDGARLVGKAGGWSRAITGSSASDGAGGAGGAKRWEAKTLAFDNTAGGGGAS
jgi:ectonucleotide pyrophosphatase/phosphodiesterase family protein 4